VALMVNDLGADSEPEMVQMEEEVRAISDEELDRTLASPDAAFRELSSELYLAATDLDTCERRWRAHRCRSRTGRQDRPKRRGSPH